MKAPTFVTIAVCAFITCHLAPGLAQTTTDAVGSAPAQPLRSPTSQTNATATQPPLGEQLPATTRAQAIGSAKLNAGRNNPFSPVEGGFKVFNNDARDVPKTRPDVKKAEKFAPPPPPPNIGQGLGPAAASGDLLNANELPPPPDKPAIANQMKLTAIMGDRAIFSFDPGVRAEHKWPKTVALSPGEQFETVSVVSISTDAVTVQEDGDRSVKELDRIR